MFNIVNDSCNYLVISNDRKLIYPYELDIIIPDIKVAFEYCGLYWHSERFLKEKNYHLNKLKLHEQAGYILVTVFEDEWLYKKDKVMTKIKSYLINKDLVTDNLVLSYISENECQDFCNKYLLDNYKYCILNIGVYNEGSIVAVASFDLLSEENYNRVNFCSKYYFYNNQIFKMITKFFKSSNNYRSVSLLLDRQWENYKVNNDLTLMRCIKPSYLYVNQTKHYKAKCGDKI